MPRVGLAVGAVLMLAVACGGRDAPVASVIPTVAAAATRVALPVVQAPPVFAAADYANGEEVVHLLEALGEERVFPAELMPDAPEISKDEAEVLLTEYLAGTRIVGTKFGQITDISDYCENGFGSRLFSSEKGPEGVWNVGIVFAWTLMSDELTAWNRPILTSPGVEIDPTFVLRGISAVGGTTIIPPVDGEPPEVKGGFGGSSEIRVFDIEDCRGGESLLDASAAHWEVLGIGAEKPFPDVLKPGMPQLPKEEVESIWTEYLTDMITFDIETGLPNNIHCADGGIVAFNRTASYRIFGQTGSWRAVDASQIATNAVYFEIEFDDPEAEKFARETERFKRTFLLPLAWDQPNRNALGFDLSPCSLEAGFDFIERMELPDVELPFRTAVRR